jgi:hypothetical protein
MPRLLCGSDSYVPAGAPTLLATGRGRLLALLLSHSQSTHETVTLYDNNAPGGTVLLRIIVAPQASPFYCIFPVAAPVRFSTGLAVDGGACEVFAILEAAC